MKPDRRPPPRCVFVACLVFACAAARAQSGEDLLAGMKTLLATDRDFFARVSVSDDRRTAGEFYYFRSDARPAFLFYQTFPAFLTGVAWLRKGPALQGFNPDCGCAAETDPAVMRARAGFSFDELNPLALTRCAVRGTASAGRVGDEAAVVLVLAPPDGPDPSLRLSLSASSSLPLRLEYLDERGGARRTVDYLAYFEIEKKFFPRLVRATERDAPALVAELSEVSLNPLPDFVFTRAYLEELGR